MTTSTAPFPYKTPYFTQMEPVRFPDRVPVFQTADSMPSMRDFTFIVERQLVDRLSKISSEVERYGWNAQFTSPARLEFVYNDGVEGMLLFDSRGRLIVHVTTAKLGYDGYGGTVSKKIMRALGVPEQLIAQLWRETHGLHPYVIVVSREEHTTEEDGYAIRGLDVKSEWEWWRSY